jgi:hypothetical protein
MTEKAGKRYFKYLAMCFVCLIPALLGFIVHVFSGSYGDNFLGGIIVSLLVFVVFFPYAYSYILLFILIKIIVHFLGKGTNKYIILFDINFLILIVFAIYWTLFVDSSKIFLGE